MSLSPFAEATLAVAIARVDNAVRCLEDRVDPDCPDPKRRQLAAEAYRELLVARGELRGVQNLIAYEDELRNAAKEHMGVDADQVVETAIALASPVAR